MLRNQTASLLVNKFTIENYKKTLDKHSLKEVWDCLLNLLVEKGIKEFEKKIVNFYDIGRLYEIGLAHVNKYSKKDTGKYYTPKDVSLVMAQLLTEDGELSSLADTGCGCGNLTIEVLKIINERNIDEFNTVIKNLYLFDMDEIAINICVKRIEALFDVDLKNKVHIICGDFLDKRISLPENCFVITNPPYNQVKNIDSKYNYLSAFKESKDLYIGFIEKIAKYCCKAVIVSPQSFIVGSKFKKIREMLASKYSGEIYSFDNVPGTLFDGRKEGVFNTNTANGVRASITKITKTTNPGFRLSHLIRFKSIERSKVINLKYLKNQLGNKIQDLQRPIKCFVELEPFVYEILKKSNQTIADLVSPSENDYALHINSSARYFIVCSKTKLDRDGSFDIFAKNYESFICLYALLNSSYAYLWWRMFDGGILLPKSLLLSIPIPCDIYINEKMISDINNIIRKEKKYLVYKKNAGKLQESIKFPNDVRDKLNSVLFNGVQFNIIHKNTEAE